MKKQFQLRPIAAAIASLRIKPQTAAAESRTAIRKLLPLGAMLAGMSLAPQGAFAQTAPVAGETTLPTVNVKADADQQDGTRATATRVGKTLQDPQDIPQAVTTVTKTMMDEQQVGSLREALRNVSGLSFNAAEGGRAGDNFNLRSFYTFGDVYLDGIRDTAQYNRETFNLEQVDVLRGAAAMLFGRGQAGGVINQVSKTPLRFDQYNFSASVGTRGYREATADLNMVFSADTALRVNMMQRDEGSWRVNPASGTEAEIHRKGIAFSLALNQDSTNKFWLNQYYAETHDNPDYGISFNAATRAPGTILPASTFFNGDRNFDDSTTSITTLVNEYTISADSMLRTQARYAHYERSYWAKTPNLTTLPTATAGTGGNVTRSMDYETITLQSDLTTRLQALGMKHEILAGAEYFGENSHRRSLQAFGTAPAPLYLPYAESGAASTDFKSNSYAFYAQDTVEFIPKWKGTLGIRRDQLDADFSSATSPQLSYGENSYRAALSFQPTDAVHYYVSWSDTFSPTADLYQLTVAPLPPERSNVTEIGTKWLVGDLSLRAAIYHAVKKWERNGDLEATAAVLTNKRSANGLELEAAGRINDRWEMFTGFSYIDSEILDVATNINAGTGAITRGNAGYIGQVARNTPKYTFNLWTTYKVTGPWKIGGGMEYKAERQGFNPSGAGAVPTLNGVYYPNTAPAYTRFDALVAYEQPKWTVRLNIKNLFNKLYYESIYDNGGFTVPGTRRQAILTTELKF